MLLDSFRLVARTRSVDIPGKPPAMAEAGYPCGLGTRLSETGVDAARVCTRLNSRPGREPVIVEQLGDQQIG